MSISYYRCLCGEEFEEPKILRWGDEVEEVCPECKGLDYKAIGEDGEPVE